MHLVIIKSPQDPRFVRVEVNGFLWKEIDRYWFVNHFKTLTRCLDEEALKSLWPDLEKKVIETGVMRLLSRKGYFSLELRRKLQERKFSEEAITYILEKCERLGYLDDEREKERLIRQEKQKGKGPRFIAHKLKTKGVKGEMEYNQTEMLAHLLKTRYRKYDLTDYQHKQKVALSLQRRGFDFELISALIYKDN